MSSFVEQRTKFPFLYSSLTKSSCACNSGVIVMPSFSMGTMASVCLHLFTMICSPVAALLKAVAIFLRNVLTVIVSIMCSFITAKLSVFSQSSKYYAHVIAHRLLLLPFCLARLVGILREITHMQESMDGLARKRAELQFQNNCFVKLQFGVRAMVERSGQFGSGAKVRG